MKRAQRLAQRRQAAEDVALFIAALVKDRAPALLESLSEASREAALLELSAVGALDSSARQAKIARAFGEHEAASEKLRDASVDASPMMRRALRKALPAYYRALVSEPGDSKSSSTIDVPVVVAQVAERVVHEALR